MTTAEDDVRVTPESVAERFTADRGRLVGLARRMLGSTADAEDAVQETWLRLSRTDPETIRNLPAWSTTTLARVCLNQLRHRSTLREQGLDEPADLAGPSTDDPEQQVELADSLGLALLVVLDTLGPVERLAFVLHDVFEVPFEQVAPVVGRSVPATRQLASRARRRVRGAALPERDPRRTQRVVDAYLAAVRHGDFEQLVTLLHPDVVLRADSLANDTGTPKILRGFEQVSQGASGFRRFADKVRRVLIDGAPGLALMARRGPAVLLTFTVVDDVITELGAIGEPDRVARHQVMIIEDG